MKNLDIGKPTQIKNFYDYEWGRVENRINMEGAHYAFKRIGISPESLKNRKVLDGGCGTGAISTVMAKYFNSQVVSVDIEKRCVDIAKNLASKNGVKIEVHEASLYELPFLEQSFDTVVSLGVVHHTGKASECFKSFYRVLKPGGELCVSLQRECFSVAVKRVTNIAYLKLPEFIRPFIYLPVYSSMWLTYKLSSRERFTPLSAAVRDALLCPYHQVETDEGWIKLISEAGFKDVRLVNPWGVGGSQGLYVGKKV